MAFESISNRNNFTSWEQAADGAVNSLFGFYESFSKNLIKYEGTEFRFKEEEGYSFICSKSNLINIQSIVDIYINKKMYLKQDFSDETVAMHQQFLVMIAAFAIDVAKDISFNLEDFSYYKDDLVKTLIRKQNDYGPENIAKFGITGLTIRMYDKIARLTNLSSTDRKQMVQDEPLFDTALDLIGYCAIGIMWCDQTFLLPMKGLSSLR